MLEVGEHSLPGTDKMALLCYVLLVCWAWTSPCLTSSAGFPGTPQECKQAPFIPGYNLGGEGFDIVSMKRKGAYVINTEMWKQGNDSCRLYNNIYMNNEKQKIPVAMTDWRTLPKCSLKVSSSRYNSVEALVNSSTSSVSNNWKIGLNVEYKSVAAGLTLGGSHSREADFAVPKSKQDRYEFFRHSVHCSFYSYRTSTNPPLSPDFESALKAISPSDPTKEVLYRNLIDIYGTHYITQVSLGGEIKATTAVRTCEATLNGVSTSEIEDCLSVEASLHFARTNSINSMVNHCKAKKAKLGHSLSFSSMFNERISEVIGGNIEGTDVLFQQDLSKSDISSWMSSLQTTPDVIRYNLKPLHTILPSSHPALAPLKVEIEKHIVKNAVLQKCSESCKIGARSNKREPCACVCSNIHNMKSNCCPAGKGFATLKVFNLYAHDLNGDWITQTDASVQVQYGDENKRTIEITNNDNPTWPETFVFNAIQMNMKDRLTFKVYDADWSWNSDLLGVCSFEIRRGQVSNSCMFDDGTFFFTYEVECAPSLGGDKCQEHQPSPMSASLANDFYSRNGVLMGESANDRAKKG